MNGILFQEKKEKKLSCFIIHVNDAVRKKDSLRKKSSRFCFPLAAARREQNTKEKPEQK
jgi:hypothetical protein